MKILIFISGGLRAKKGRLNWDKKGRKKMVRVLANYQSSSAGTAKAALFTAALIVSQVHCGAASSVDSFYKREERSATSIVRELKKPQSAQLPKVESNSSIKTHVEDDEASSVFSDDEDLRSHQFPYTQDKLYSALINTFPVGISNMLKRVEVDQLDKYCAHHPSESVQTRTGYSSGGSGEDTQSSSHDHDSLLKTRGSSINCSTVAVPDIKRVMKSINFFQEEPSSVEGMGDIDKDKDDGIINLENEIKDDSSNIPFISITMAASFSGNELNFALENSEDPFYRSGGEFNTSSPYSCQSDRIRSASPYSRGSRVNSVDNLAVEDNTIIEQGGPEITADQLKIFDAIDALASDSLHTQTNHVGVFILEELLVFTRQIPLIEDTNSLGQAYDLLNQLTKIYAHVASSCKGRRLEYVQLIEECLSATITRLDKRDPYRIERDALLLLILNNATVFDEVYIQTNEAYDALGYAAHYSNAHGYFDSVDYIRQIHHFPSYSDLQVYFDLPPRRLDGIEVDPNSNYLPLEEAHLRSARENATNVVIVNHRGAIPKWKSYQKKHKKQKTHNQLIHRPRFFPKLPGIPRLIMDNPGMFITAIMLAFILQCFLFQKN